MTDWATTEPDELLDELEYLRHSGLASFDVAALPLIGQLVTEASHGVPGAITIRGVREFVREAVGALDDNRFETSAACAFGLNDPESLTKSVGDRTQTAADARGMTAHGYNHKPGHDKRWADLRLTARSAVDLHRERVVMRLREQQRAGGLAQMPTLVIAEPPAVVSEYLGSKSADDWLGERRANSEERWTALLRERDEQLRVRGELSDKLCMFASGSYGRDEAMEFSDLDLFLIDDAKPAVKEEDRLLNKFELGAALALIDKVRLELGIQGFSQGGYYQEPQSFRRMLVEGGGRREGPSTLTTARSLLLINSRCLYNEPLFADLRTRALDDYWGANPPSKRIWPTFLLNDLRRTWLTMLVTFEHFYPKEVRDGHARSDARRRVAGLKLSVPQQLGCYTPILGLLDRSNEAGLTRADAEQVLSMTTSQRLDSLMASSDPTVAEAASGLRELYGQYLGFSWCDKHAMFNRVEHNWPAIKAHFQKVHKLILLMLWAFQARIPEVARYALV